MTPSPFDRLRAFPPHVREPALAVLDELTSPLSPRELDRAIQSEGYTRAEARRLTRVLKRLHVVALISR